jgi:hypothetical protein
MNICTDYTTHPVPHRYHPRCDSCNNRGWVEYSSKKNAYKVIIPLTNSEYMSHSFETEEQANIYLRKFREIK